MALSQALSTGITGLQTHQKCMDNIGHNLANVNTVGFKKGVYQFSTLLEQTLRGGMLADETTGRGSVNPIAMGLGAQTMSINKVFTQGSIENTANPNDMAIEGNGFFVLGLENGYAYTRCGSFYRGADGSLMGGDGLYVQGTMAVKQMNGSYKIPQDAKLQNIVIPIGQTGGQAQTSEMAFTGNLDSRQPLSTGTRLFGSTAYPTTGSLQQWMWKDYDGGDVNTEAKVDETWDSLQERTFAVSVETLESFGYQGTLPKGVTSYARGTVTDVSATNFGDTTYMDGHTAYYALCIDSGTTPPSQYVVKTFAEDPDTGVKTPMSFTDINKGEAPLDQVNKKYIPLTEEIKAVNGGNVQTSAAMGIRVPEYLAVGEKITIDGEDFTVGNEYIMPLWFYESTGANLDNLKNLVTKTNDEITKLESTVGGVTLKDEQAYLYQVWPPEAGSTAYTKLTGPDGRAMNRLPHADETMPATLDTQLEHVMYRKGNVWVSPFLGIKNGDEINISFTKGDAQVDAVFKYNRPDNTKTFNGQIKVDYEQSYTLEHLLKFLGGDVNEPTVAAAAITPAMFGAIPTKDYPEGDPNAIEPHSNPPTPHVWDRSGYEDALKNVSLAKHSVNLDSTGGAMGLLSLSALISANNYGNDGYDAPFESGGAYTRSGVTQVYYDVWDPASQSFVPTPADSYNASFVSNLGSENALGNITFSFRNVTHDAMFRGETDYNAPQGGSAVVTVDVYDSLGNPKELTVRLSMVEQDDDFTTWRWYADSTADTDFPWQADPMTGELMSNLNVGTGTIRFDKYGNFVKSADYSETGGITINQTQQGVNEPLVVQILNGLAGKGQDLDFSELTCTATNNSYKLKSQNGYPPGTLDAFSVSLDGVIQGTYSNGNVLAIARIGLATFANNNGLVSAGSNLFYEGPASGDALYGHAGVGGNGSIRHMQLESSNVDLSEEFTKLISTERGFQANSRTITTADEMITELLNLKR